MSSTVMAMTTANSILQLFPEIDPELAASTAPADADLAGYDAEQVRLMEEVCIVLDKEDNPIGSASKKACMYSTPPSLYPTFGWGTDLPPC